MNFPSIILFDGVCNFCNGTVNFLIRHDKKNSFRYAALQSEAGKKILVEINLPASSTDSLLLFENGEIYKSSTAALKIYNKLSWHWKWTQFFWIIPKFIRDAAYDFIARNRYKLFGKKEQCMIPSREVRKWFID